MNRDELISQVKNEYARLADLSSKENFVDKTGNSMKNEAYYEHLLQDVINRIQNGDFDNCSSGKEIVETIANGKIK